MEIQSAYLAKFLIIGGRVFILTTQSFSLPLVSDLFFKYIRFILVYSGILSEG